MARPTKPKDIKPKAENSGGEAPAPVPAPKGDGAGLDLKFIITLVVVVLSTSLSSVGAVYFLAPMVIAPLVGDAAAAGEETDGTVHGPMLGLNLELDEFTVNLKPDPHTPGDNQYLRAKMSLNVSVPDEQNCHAMQHAWWMPDTIKGGKIVGAAATVHEAQPPVNREYLASAGHGGGADPYTACLDEFKNNMAKFVPTMRDVINASLMKRTAGTLSSIEGQEMLKDEIKEEINQFMTDGYEVSRVNFEDFIIQR